MTAPQVDGVPRLLTRFTQTAARQVIMRDALTHMAQQPEAKLPIAARPAGDERVLRGIPVVGVHGGFGGAIIGTNPGSRKIAEKRPNAMTGDWP